MWSFFRFWAIIQYWGVAGYIIHCRRVAGYINFSVYSNFRSYVLRFSRILYWGVAGWIIQYWGVAGWIIRPPKYTLAYR
jgi:hypothetical protein